MKPSCIITTWISISVLWAWNPALGQDNKLLVLKGSANAQVKYYNNSFRPKIPGLRPAFIANVNAQPVLLIKGWTVNTRFVLGSFQSKFRDFNRLGISPQKGGIRLYLGHNTINWSQFALEGRPILGAGCDIKSGKLRMGAFVGKIHGAAAQDTIDKRIYFAEFLRPMIALRLGYGDDQNFIHAIGLSAADKPKSLDPKEAPGLNPAANGVLALKLGRKFSPRLSMLADGAYSAYTANTYVKAQELFGVRPARLPGMLIKTNATTSFMGALALLLKYEARGFSLFKTPFAPSQLSLEYNRIEPGFQSMALYFLVNDIERIKAGITLKPLSQKFSLNLNLGFEHNDLLNTQFISNKRIISGAIFNYRLNPAWNLGASVQNYAVRLLADVNADHDSLLLNQVNRNYTLSANGFLGNNQVALNKRSRVMAMLGYQAGQNIIASSKSRPIGHFFLQGSYMPASLGRWVFGGSYSLHNYKTIKTLLPKVAYNSSTRHMPALTAERIWSERYRIRIESGLILTWVNGKSFGLGWRNSVAGLWNINRKNFLQLTFFHQKNSQFKNAVPPGAKALSFSELQADLRYGLRF